MNNNSKLIDVHQLSTEQLVALFSTLQAPSIEEMHGEYAASMLSQPNPLATLAGLSLTNPLLPWQSKAFRPVNQLTGRGYNTFLLGRKTIQLYPMHTLIAPSRFDGQPAYQLVYCYFHSLCGVINMVDEIRRLDGMTDVIWALAPGGLTRNNAKFRIRFYCKARIMTTVVILAVAAVVLR